jgi:hypothetical protein
MNSSEEINNIWGGRLEAIWFDPGGSRVDLVIAVASGDDVRRFRIEAESVREFRFVSDHRGKPWFYAEVTEASIRSVGDDMIQLVILLWSEDNLIEVLARSIEMRVQS